MDDKSLFGKVITVPEVGFPAREDVSLDLSRIPPEKEQKIDQVLIPEKYIKGRVNALAKEIFKDYEKVKEIYIGILHDKSIWDERFKSLKAEFKSRPAFREEISKL